MQEARAGLDPTQLGLSAAEVRDAEERAGRALTQLEWAIVSVLWSEHCAYKHSRPLLGQLPRESARLLAGPGESAGVLDIGSGWAVAAKIESHNHPSAVEPFQGAATGVGGIMRDILAMGARPAAFLDSLRFGDPTSPRVGYLEAGVVGGIGHYGNCVGVPTVGGDVYYHASYERNPLVNAMCVGFLRHTELRTNGAAGGNSRFLLIGATTGRDGVGGAAFASVALREDAAKDRPHVQVGDPFLGKLLIEATLEILERVPVVAIQDLGAGGIAGAAIEMSAKGEVGVQLRLENVPLRESDMAPLEILLSESQERMLLCIPEQVLPLAHEIAERWGVTHAEIGRLLQEDEVRILMGDEVLSSLPASLYAEAPTAQIHPAPPAAPVEERPGDETVVDIPLALLSLLTHPNLRDRSNIYVTYDQDVGLRTVCRPGLDAAVLRAAPGAPGVAVTTDQNPRYCAASARIGAELSVVEAVRNVLARGAVPIGLTNCLNLGDPDTPDVARQLVDTVDGIRLAAERLRIPVTGGNVSLYNLQLSRGIVPTPVIGMLGLLEDPERAIGVLPPKGVADVVLIGTRARVLDASAYAEWRGLPPGRPDEPDYDEVRAAEELLTNAADLGVWLAHDLSDGGLLAALAEVALHVSLGIRVRLPDASAARLFGEPACQFVLLVKDGAAVVARASALGLCAERIGETLITQMLSIAAGETAAEIPLAVLADARRGQR